MKHLWKQGGQQGVPSVLDIGCGQGAFLDQAQADGARVAGVELDPHAVAACHQRGLFVTQGSMFDVELPKGSWDVITLWDVLDHLEEPRAALTLLCAQLFPAGFLVVRGRNGDLHSSLKAACGRSGSVAGRIGVRDLSVVHRWGFSPTGFERLLRSSGLEEIRRHPGLPTPGDRYGTMGPRILVSVVKATVRWTGQLLFYGSKGRLYLFPSVLVSGRKSVR